MCAAQCRRVPPPSQIAKLRPSAPAQSADASLTTADQYSVLVVGTDEWAIAQSAMKVGAAGHQVLLCHDQGEPAFPCNAVRPGRTCPLDQGVHAIVTSRARPVDVISPSEVGVVCALHANVPVVVSGISRGAPFAAWAAATVPGQGDLADVLAQVLTAEGMATSQASGSAS